MAHVGALVTPLTSLSQWNHSQQQSSEQIDTSQLYGSIQKAFRDKGLIVLMEFSAKLDKLQAQTEKDGAGGFSKTLVKRLFNESGIALSEPESRALMKSLSDSEQVTAQQIRNVICTKMNDKRIQLVQNAFEQMDRQQNGYVPLAELYRSFDASKHPVVLFGDKNVDQVKDEFDKSIVAITNKTNNVLTPSASNFINMNQWLTLFQFQSVFFPNDDLFELFMRRVWRVSTNANAAPAMTMTKQASGPIEPNAGSSSKATAIKCDESSLSSSEGALHTTMPAIGEKEDVSPSRLAINSGSPMHNGFGKKKKPAAFAQANPMHSNQDFLKSSQIAECFCTEKPGNVPVIPKKTGSMDVGTASIVDRLSQTLRSRGLGGIVKLQRALRAMDDADDRDGKLTLAQFKQVTKDEQLNLNDVDVRLLFMYLDYDQVSKVRLTSFNQLIRHEPINQNRQQIIREAFEKIDADGDSFLDVHEIIQAFDASRHPDVLAGKRTESQVFEDFVENFEVDFGSGARGSESDQALGRISFQQWEEFYKNVSFTTKEDDLFDLLIRNTWQLPARDESMSTNKNVGSEPPEKEWRLHTKRHVSGGQGYQAMAVLQPNRDLEFEHMMKSKSRTVLDTSGCQYKAHQQSKEIRRVIAQIRNSLRDQGINGILDLSRKFRQLDLDQNGSISFDEFQRALKDSKFFLSALETRRIFEYFDINHDNCIDFDEFLAGVQEPMNEKRQLLVRMAFDTLDRDGKGVLQVRDMVNTFDPRKHPEVVTGRKTEQDILEEFYLTLDIDKSALGPDQVMDFAAWSRYYQNISATIQEDDYFELLLCNVWHLSYGKNTATTNISNRRAPTLNLGDDSSREGIKRDGVHELLKQQPEARRSSDPQVLYGSSEVVHLTDNTSKTKSFRKNTSNASSGFTNCIVMESSTPNPQGRRRSMDAGKRTTEQVAHPMGVQAILTRLKAVLKSRGAHGFCGLSRKFRLMDEDGNGSLSLSEFKKAIKTSDLDVCDADLRLLFEYFDRDRNGTIDLGEFLSGIRDPMNERRMKFVDQAFRLMDTDKNGLLEPSDIVEKYDASRHPEVLSGFKTEEQVFREFLDTFDVDGVHNGKVTWEQWVHYYQNISASIDEDDYFELMMRNAWHLAGGEGWCENTTNQRVLVTLDNGSHGVKVVQNDLGIKTHDVPDRLRAQEDVRGGNRMVEFATSSRVDVEFNTPPQARTSNTMIATPAQSTTSSSTKPTGGSNSKTLSLKEAAAAIAMKTMTSTSINSPTGAAAMDSAASNSQDEAQVLLTSLRRHLQRKKLGELLQFRKQLLKHVDPKDDTISMAVFMESLTVVGVRLREAQCDALFRLLDDQADSLENTPKQAWAFGALSPRALHPNVTGKASRISTKRVLEALFGKLKNSCADQLRNLFTVLQRNGKGRVFHAALAKSFCAERFPDVELGVMSADDLLRMFAMHFEVGSCSDGSISLEQFNVFGLHFYTTLAINANDHTDDDYFAAVLQRCFQVS